MLQTAQLNVPKDISLSQRWKGKRVDEGVCAGGVNVGVDQKWVSSPNLGLEALGAQLCAKSRELWSSSEPVPVLLPSSGARAAF